MKQFDMAEILLFSLVKEFFLGRYGAWVQLKIFFAVHCQVFDG
jgi:hypothetical protein